MKSPVIYALTSFMTLLSFSFAQKAATWDECLCRWEKWAAWSKCNKLCYGRQIRYRAVWKKSEPKCSGFNVCDLGKGGRQIRRCNKRCTNGHWNETKKKCVCPKGKMGECCDEDIKCAAPNPFDNGRPDKTVVDYGGKIGFECDKGYTLTGDASVICGDNGLDGSIPSCEALNPCKDNPCTHGRVCEVDGSGYTCNCPKGMTGPTCNIDASPPEVVNCTDDVRLNSSKRRIEYSWTSPTFLDPHGSDVVVTSNYPEPHFLFPWGDFEVQYIGVKRSNGMRAKCQFNVKVRPLQCPELSPPEHGYVVCNSWFSEYGRFCLFGCKDGFTLPGFFSGRQWAVCGSTGQWTPGQMPTSCEESLSSMGDPKSLPTITDCEDLDKLESIKKLYIQWLNDSSFKNFCTKHSLECNERNVTILC